MKIKQLDIAGFRSLRNAKWCPGDLNVIIGPNGTGKSNLLRFLELIALSAQGKLGKHIQSLGGMDPILWDGKADTISFEINTTQHNYALTLKRLGLGSAYFIGYEQLIYLDKVKIALENKPIRLLERNSQSAEVYNGDSPPFVRVDDISEEESLLSFVHSFMHSDLVDYQHSLSKISVYHDLHTDKNATIRQPSITRFEKRVDPDGQNLISVLHTLYTGDRDFKNDINAAMQAAFGDDFDELVFPPAADQRIQLRIRWKSLQREQSAADLSDGTLRFLFLLTVLASPSPAPIIAIDEPETGLHPSMLPIVAEYAAEAATRAQVIFTTHSPQFLDAFSGIPITMTVAKWQNGETVLQTLNQEDLNYWLNDYTLGALFKSGELEHMA